MVKRASSDKFNTVVAAMSIASLADPHHDQVRRLLANPRICSSPMGTELRNNELLLEALCLHNFLLNRQLKSLKASRGVNGAIGK